MPPPRPPRISFPPLPASSNGRSRQPSRASLASLSARLRYRPSHTVFHHYGSVLSDRSRPEQKRLRIVSASYSNSVVSCAPSSATNTAINSAPNPAVEPAGSVVLALAETRWVEPGGSKKDWPTPNVSTGPPPSWERI